MIASKQIAFGGSKRKPYDAEIGLRYRRSWRASTRFSPRHLWKEVA